MGTKQIDAKMPMGVDASKACVDKTDKRILSSHIIKTIAGDSTKKIDPTGLRIIGAIFCDNLNLIGLNLPYSLVLDRSIFVRGIEARNFQISGDFSLDGTLIFGELLLPRAHIGGTIFASKAFIQKTEILDTDIQGSVLFRSSLFLEPAIFDTARISGELSLQQAAFPYFLLQFSTVGGPGPDRQPGALLVSIKNRQNRGLGARWHRLRRRVSPRRVETANV
jgi:hypothetical protein